MAYGHCHVQISFVGAFIPRLDTVDRGSHLRQRYHCNGSARNTPFLLFPDLCGGVMLQPASREAGRQPGSSNPITMLSLKLRPHSSRRRRLRRLRNGPDRRSTRTIPHTARSGCARDSSTPCGHFTKPEVDILRAHPLTLPAPLALPYYIILSLLSPILD